MTRRTRWALLSAGIVAVVVVAALLWAPWSSPRQAKTWIVRDGTKRTFSADLVEPGDLFRCTDGVGARAPEPGHGVGGSGGISVMTAPDGSITVDCQPGPPGNA
jgi:hypothetical protein